MPSFAIVVIEGLGVLVRAASHLPMSSRVVRVVSILAAALQATAGVLRSSVPQFMFILYRAALSAFRTASPAMAMTRNAWAHLVGVLLLARARIPGA